MQAEQKFFAHPEQFEHLQRKLLPQLVELTRKGNRLRIWAPGCGNGAEAYSIAMTILDVAPDARCLDIRILATDPDPQSLHEARMARYAASEMSSVPELFKARWVEPITAKSCQLDAAVRDLVSFQVLPLTGPYGLTSYFNAIFCRNVLTALSAGAQQKAWAEMMPLLAPGGMLYTGNEERITGPALAELKMAGQAAYLRMAA